MEFFSHQSIRKYTLALLDTFNDIQIERMGKNNTPFYVPVPISFGSKDKAFVLSTKELEQWQQGNYNILPRMSLSLLTMNKENKRDTNRLHTINKVVDGKTINFQYNAVSYIFTYELAIATRGMNELSMILEQILPYFNPSVRLTVKEIEMHENPTSIPVNLLSVDLDLPNNIGSEDDIRIVGATLMLELKGNLYQPFRGEGVIEMVRLYFNAWENETIQDTAKSIKYEFSVDSDTHLMIPSTLEKTDFDQLDTVGKNPPVISNIEGSTSINVGEQTQYKVIFSDPDDEDFFRYIWNVLSGEAMISGTKDVIALTATQAGSITIQVQIVDKWGNISNFKTLSITAN